MRYTLILLLLSACAGVPESPTGTYYAGGAAIGPSNWGYGQGSTPPAGAPCYDANYPPAVGPPYSSSYNCATPLFYSRNPYYPYFSALTPAAFSLRGVYLLRPRSSGVATAARIASGHGKKRK